MARLQQQNGVPKQPKQRKRKRPELEQVDEQAADTGDNKLTRALGSPDFSTREKGLQILTRWLTHRPNISDSDLNKIWKGLFYSFWHSDKQPVQEALAERLAQILPELSNEVAFAYFRAFFTAMRREWFGIDRLRLDKFMMLVRKFVQQTFVHLRNIGWESAEVETYTGFLTEQVLLKQDGQPALGLVYHLADCYVPELLSLEVARSIPAAAVAQLLAPFAELLARVQQQPGVNRVLTGVFKPLLDAAADNEQDEGGTGPFADADVLSALSAAYFELGASPGVKTKNREALYELSRRLEKAGKAATGRSGGTARPHVPTTAAIVDDLSAPTAQSPAAAASPASSRKAKSGTKAKSERRTMSRLAQSSSAEEAPVLVNAQQPAAAVPAAAGVECAVAATAIGSAAAGSKKKKRRKMDADGAAATLAAQAADGALEQSATPVTRGSAAAASLRQNGATDASAAAASPSTPASDKKGVHFRLKKNLYFTYGGPLPPPDVRTPPSAKPKGSALRRTPATDPVKTQLSTPVNGKRNPARKSPRSIPRSKAASFF